MRSRTLLRSLTIALAGFCSLGRVAFAADLPAVGDKATDFTLNSLEGQPVKLHDLTAKGPVVLVVLRGYPGYQCPVCSAQVSSLISKAENFKTSSVVFVYPGPADSLKARAKEFVAKKSMPEGFTLLLDPDYKFTNQYHLRWDEPSETAYPSTFVIVPDNTIRYSKISKTHCGRASVKEITGALDALKTKAK